ncbi:MAG TPA: flagellar hook-length control protein FliK [Candidatus Ozemobacteraceae bacterium]|nr:flagellar hook-length control protein FliK [Candidatus Ozemobacteraceae bacterium]
MKTATDHVDTSSLVNVFFTKSFTPPSQTQSGPSSFGELLSGLVNSKSNVSFSSKPQKPAATERTASAGRPQEVSQRPSKEHAVQTGKDTKRIDQKPEKPRMSSKDTTPGVREKPSFEKSEGSKQASDASNALEVEVLQESHKIVNKLNSNDDSSAESALSALRADETVGEFWQSLDDKTALDLIESLEAMTPDILAASLELMKAMKPEVQAAAPEVEEQPDLIEAVDAISEEDQPDMPEDGEGSSEETDEIEAVSAQAVPVQAAVQVQETEAVSETAGIPVETEAVSAVQETKADTAAAHSAQEAAKPVVSEKKQEASDAGKPSDKPATDSQSDEVLSALRRNPETAEFWKNVDDETAHKLLSVLSKMKGGRTGEKLVATLSDEKPVETVPETDSEMTVDTFSQTMGSQVETTAGEKRPERKLREKSDAKEPSAVTTEGESGVEPERKATFGSDVKSLRQEYREARESRSHSASAQTGSAGVTGASSGAFAVTTSAQVAISGDAPDISDLLKSFQSRGETGKADGHQALNAASNQNVKRVSMSGHETSREFSFTRDNPSNAQSVRSDTSQSKGGDTVKSAIFSQIIEKAEFFKGPQQIKFMTLQLKPEALGKLEMQLATKDGTVTARISAENAVVKEKLEQLVPQIREHLEQQGVNILQISVDVSRRESDGSDRGMSNGEHQPGLRIGSRRSSRNGSADSDAVESSVLINPEIRRMALHIKAVDVTV